MAKIILTLPNGSGGGSGNVVNYIDLLDKTTVNLPIINTPLSDILDNKQNQLIAGTNINIDNTNPLAPVISTVVDGNFIPLSGTTVDNPVTGTIELDNGVQIQSVGEKNVFGFQGSETFIYTDDDTYQAKNSITTFGVSFISNNSNAKGFYSNTDFSSNITDLDYTQKIYVDTKIAGVTLSYTPEDIANKSSSYTVSSTTTYPNTKALVDGLGTKQNILTNPVIGTGVNGQISFWNNINTQSSDSNLVWDNTNKRLGIAESAPLDVLVVSKTVGANIGQIRFGGSNGRTLSAYNNGSLANFDFVSNLSYFSGNLGIGAQKYISIYNNAGNIANYYQQILDASENVSFRINGANSYVISPNRNILINTTTDNITDKLQVNGTVSSGTTTLNNTPPTANNHLTRKDYVDLKAPIASPTFTGIPTAPTATAGTNTTQIATTAFVQSELTVVNSDFLLYSMSF